MTAQFSLTVAIGMGGVSALLSLLLALGYQPLPYRDPGRLVAVWERAQSGEIILLSESDLADFAGANQNIFSSLGAVNAARVWLLDREGAKEFVACGIQASVFKDLGVRPVLGREPRPDDEPLTGTALSPAWISDRLWRTRYGGSPSVIGKKIGLADSAAGAYQVPRIIVGVLPPNAGIPLPVSWASEMEVCDVLPRDIAGESRESTFYFGVGRLRPGVTVAQAQSAVTAVAERLGQRYSFDRGNVPVVESLEEIAQGPARKTMGLLALGVGLVFLVGCVNLTILMGAEGRRLRREIAVRTVLGASHLRLWGEAAAEKCALTLLSLGLGAGFAFELLRVLTQLMPAAGLGAALLRPPPLNLIVLLCFVAFALITTLVWSALLVRVANASESSRTLAAGSGPGYTGFSDSSPGASRWRLILLAAQAGVGITLLAAAALTARTYATLAAANLGPAPSHTVLLSVQQRDNFVPTDAQVADFDQQVLSGLGRLPGTQTVALAYPFPPPAWPKAFVKEGDAAGTEREATDPIPVSPSYFRTLGIPILFGRAFGDSDTKGSEPVAIISLEMAQKNWTSPGQAIGSQIVLGSKSQYHYKIVGVAGNFTGYWAQKPSPVIYLPIAQAAYALGGGVILRTTSPRAVEALARQALAGMPIPALISDVSTMQARWQATVTRPQARMVGMLLLALLGLALSIQGVYAVAAATASARRHELAVRATLGALPGRLVWSLTRDLVLAVIIGAALGIAASLELRPVLVHWLGSVAVWEAEPILAAVLLMALAAAAGCYLPARSAARANPAEILRHG